MWGGGSMPHGNILYFPTLGGAAGGTEQPWRNTAL